MSGIAGIIHLDGAPADPERLERMLSAAAYRGPDGRGAWTSGPASLGFLKLATTPEDVGDSQPYEDPESGLVIVFDGRLDNRDELFRELPSRYCLPRDAPDCRVALTYYRLRGERSPDSFTGDFAYAVWDPRKRELFCARSLCGRRPFLWWSDGGKLLFGSDPVQLVAGGVEKKINEPVVAEVLSLRFMTPDETLLEGVRRLQPGFALTAGEKGVRVRRWHEGPFPELRLESGGEYVERFLELFDRALTAAFRSTTGVAAHLSGGLDSSSIVCRAAELHASGKVGRLVEPLSMVFPGRPWDESPWIDLAAGKSGLEPLRLEPPAYDWDEARAWCRRTLHLPIRPNSATLTHAPALRERGIRVLLTGQGGDEWLGGSCAHWADLLRRGQLFPLVREWRRATRGRPVGSSLYFLGSNALGPWVKPSVRRTLLYPEVEPSLDIPPWIRPEWGRSAGLVERAVPREDMPKVNGFGQMARYRAFIRAKPHILQDNVLCHSAVERIEMRDPFHHRPLGEFILASPGCVLRHDGVRKSLLREAMRGTLPEEIRARTTKTSFNGVVAEVLGFHVTPESVAGLAPVRHGWCDGETLRTGLEVCRKAASTGGEQLPTRTVMPLWFAVALDLWLREGVDGG